MSLDRETEMSITGGVTRTSLKLPDLGANSKVVFMVIVGSVVLNVLLLSLVGVLGHKTITEKKVTCDEVSCILTAGAASSNMNKSHPACSDLYEYTCGGYKLHHNIPDGMYSRTVWDDLYDTHAKRMRSAIEAVDTTTKYGMEVHTMYESCLDVDAINSSSAKPLLGIINKGDYMQWPVLKGDKWSASNFDFTKVVKALHHVHVNVFFTFTRGPNPIRPGKGALKIYPSGLNLFKWDYTSTSSYAVMRLAEYKESMIELAVKLGADNVTAFNDISDAIDFEKKLANMIPDYRSNIYSPDQTRIQGLYRGYLQIVNFDWQTYIKELYPKDKLPSDTDVVFVEDRDYFANVSKLISTTSPRTVANYMIMSMVYELANHLPDHVAGRVSAHRRYNAEKSPLTDQCSNLISRLMQWAGLRAMLDKKLIADKDSAQEIFYKMQSMLADNLKSVSDKFTKKFSKQLKDRIFGLKEKLGYPDWIKDKGQVENYYKNMSFSLVKDAYFNNVIAMSKWTKTNVLTAEEEKYKGGQGWDYYFSDFEAGYYLQGNDISVPASYMNAPMYDSKMPAAFNYGGMGVWTAWFMSYALEDNWRKYYLKNGKVQPYEPSEADSAALKEIRSCYNYVGNMTYLPPGVSKPIQIGGSWGIDYMHNDIVGTSIAYTAFKKAVSFSTDYAPGLPQDKDQLFFVAMGQFYCSATYDVNDYYHKLLNAMAASRPEFTSAFKCKKEDPLYNDGSTKCYL